MDRHDGAPDQIVDLGKFERFFYEDGPNSNGSAGERMNGDPIQLLAEQNITKKNDEGVGSISKAEIENLLQEKLEVEDPHLLEDGYGSFWLYVDGGLRELEETHEHILGVLRRIEAVMGNLNYNQLILLRDKLDYLSKVGDIIMDIPGGHRLAGEPSLKETLVSYSDVREIAEILILRLKLFLKSSARDSSPVERGIGDTLPIGAKGGTALGLRVAPKK
jgi:hypothetical protein